MDGYKEFFLGDDTYELVDRLRAGEKLCTCSPTASWDLGARLYDYLMTRETDAYGVVRETWEPVDFSWNAFHRNIDGKTYVFYERV